MIETIFMVTSIGSHAQRILTNSKDASVLGVTSRGVFLRIHERWVIFLSYEANRGPLTINLSPGIKIPVNIHPGQLVEIQDRDIIFPASNFRIRTEGATTWMISPHPRIIYNPQEYLNQIKITGEEVIAKRGEVGLTSILAELLRIPMNKQSLNNKNDRLMDLQQFHRNLLSPDSNRVVSQLQKVLGFGAGLTPSGDDLISGFLLACNRYQDVLPIPFNLTEINQAIVELAYQKTSLLSANLIECAALGLSDERLILALDGILAGTMSPASCANQLLSWGNSSGCDALLGMALAVIQPPEADSANQR
jgi:hypothetical protein